MKTAPKMKHMLGIGLLAAGLCLPLKGQTVNDLGSSLGTFNFDFGAGSGTGSTPHYASSNVSFIDSSDFYGARVRFNQFNTATVTYAFESDNLITDFSYSFYEVSEPGFVNSLVNLVIEASTDNSNWDTVATYAAGSGITEIPVDSYELPVSSSTLYIRLSRGVRWGGDAGPIQWQLWQGMGDSESTPWTFTTVPEQSTTAGVVSVIALLAVIAYKRKR